MKVINTLLLGLLFVITAMAQPPAKAQAPSDSQASSSSLDPPDVVVTQLKWQREVYVPALYEDPLRPAQEHAELEREQKATIKDNAVATKLGLDPKPLPTRARVSTDNENENVNRNSSSVTYLYEAKIKNTGVKTIRAIVWAYLIFDQETEAEVGRHRFISTLTIRAGKNASLAGRSSSAPSRIVQVSKSGKEARDKNAERVVIDRIEYADNSYWQRPSN